MKKFLICFILLILTVFFFNAEDNTVDIGKQGEVRLNLNDYVKILKMMWEKEKQEGKPEEIPVEYIVNTVNYEGEITKERVDFTANFKIQVVGPGWHIIPLFESKPGIKSAFVDGREVGFVIKDNMYAIAINKEGFYNVRVEFSLPLDNAGFSFAVSPTPITNLHLFMRSNESIIEIYGAKSVNRIQQGGRYDIYASLGAVTNINAYIVRKIEENKNAKATIQAELNTLVSVGEGLMHCATDIDYLIREAKVDKFEILIPPDVMVTDVYGNGVINYSIDEKDNEKILTVELNLSVFGQYKLKIEYEKTLPSTSGSYNVSLIKLKNVIRQKGYIGVQALTNVEINTVKKEALTEIDSKELPALIWNNAEKPILLGYKYLDSGELTLELKRHSDIELLSSICEKITYYTVVTKSGSALTKAIFTIRNTYDQFMKIKLPPKSTVWSSQLSGKPVKLSFDEKTNELLLPLEKSNNEDNNLTKFDIEIIYITEFNKFGIINKIKNTLCDTSKFVVQNIECHIWMPSDYRYFISSGTTLNKGIDGNGAYGGASYYNKQDKNIDLSKKEKVRQEDQIITQNNSNIISEEKIDNSSFERTFMKKGTLPVQIDLPTIGEEIVFSKTLPKKDKIEKVVFYCFSPIIWFSLKLVMLTLMLIMFLILFYFIIGKMRSYEELNNMHYIILGVSFLLSVIFSFILGLNISGIFSTLLLSVSAILFYEFLRYLTKKGKLDYQDNKIKFWIFTGTILLFILARSLALRLGVENNIDYIIITINVLIIAGTVMYRLIKFISGIIKKELNKIKT